MCSGAPIVEYPKGTFDDDDFPMDVGNGDGDVDLQSLETTIADTPMTDDKDDDNIIPPTEMEKTPKKAPKRKYQRKKKPVIEGVSQYISLYFRQLVTSLNIYFRAGND